MKKRTNNGKKLRGMQFTLQKERKEKAVLAKAFQIVSTENAQIKSALNPGGFGFFPGNSTTEFVPFRRNNLW